MADTPLTPEQLAALADRKIIVPGTLQDQGSWVSSGMQALAGEPQQPIPFFPTAPAQPQIPGGVRGALVSAGIIPAQGEGRMDPNAPSASATLTATPAAPVEATAAAPEWNPTAATPRTGTGARADAFAAWLAANPRGAGAGAEQPISTEFADIQAARGQRVQDARDAGNARVNDQAERNNAQMALEDQRRNDMLTERQQQLDAEVDRVANIRIDPNNWFASRGTVGSIGAAIAVGLGAAAQSLQGGNGPNNALNIINAAIDRDMQAQTENMRNQGARLNDRRSSLSMLREMTGDDRAAREAFRMRSLQMAERQIEQAAQRAQTPQAREILADMQAQAFNAREAAAENYRRQLELQQNSQRFDIEKARMAYQMRPRGGGGSRQQPFSATQMQNAQAIGGTLRRMYPNQTDAWIQNGTQSILRGGVSAGPPGFERNFTEWQQAAANAPNEQVEADLVRTRSGLNAALRNPDQPGFGWIESTGRQIGQSPDAGFFERVAGAGLRTVGRAAGFNFEISPEVSQTILNISREREQLIGATQAMPELRSVINALPDLGSAISETDLVSRADLYSRTMDSVRQTMAAQGNRSARTREHTR